jgi:hypothetical protein
MSGKKMDITKEALILFLKSLPSNETIFDVISFGSTFEALECRENKKLDCI